MRVGSSPVWLRSNRNGTSQAQMRAEMRVLHVQTSHKMAKVTETTRSHRKGVDQASLKNSEGNHFDENLILDF